MARPSSPRRSCSSRTERAGLPTCTSHGEIDTNVPHEQSVLTAAELKCQSVEHRLRGIPKAEHGLEGGDRQQIDDAYRDAFEFHREHREPGRRPAERHSGPSRPHPHCAARTRRRRRPRVQPKIPARRCRQRASARTLGLTRLTLAFLFLINAPQLSPYPSAADPAERTVRGHRLEPKRGSSRPSRV